MGKCDGSPKTSEFRPAEQHHSGSGGTFFPLISVDKAHPYSGITFRRGLVYYLQVTRQDHNLEGCSIAVRALASRSSSIIGRLIAISALRNAGSAEYRHLADQFGTLALDEAIHELQRETFVLSLKLMLAEQTEDLKNYVRFRQGC